MKDDNQLRIKEPKNMRVKNKGTESRPTLANSDDLHDEKASLGFEPQFKVLSS